MKTVRCPIPWCLLHRSSKQFDVKFLKMHLTQKHSTEERRKVAIDLGFSNYSDKILHLDYLTSQGIVV